jgi:hypothetical protein
MTYTNTTPVIPVDIDEVNYGQWLEISIAHGEIPTIDDLPVVDADIAILLPEAIRELICELQARAFTNPLRTFGFNFLSRDGYNNPEFKQTLKFCVDYTDYLIARDRLNWKPALTQAAQEVLLYNIAMYTTVYKGVFDLLEPSLKKQILPTIQQRDQTIEEINAFYSWKAQSAYRFEPNWAGDNMNPTGFTAFNVQQPQPQPQQRYTPPEQLRRQAPPPLPQRQQPSAFDQNPYRQRLEQSQQAQWPQGGQQPTQPRMGFDGPQPQWPQQGYGQQPPMGYAQQPQWPQQGFVQQPPMGYPQQPQWPQQGYAQQPPMGYAQQPPQWPQQGYGQQPPMGYAQQPQWPQQGYVQQPLVNVNNPATYNNYPHNPPLGNQPAVFGQRPSPAPYPYGGNAVYGNGMFAQPQMIQPRGILQEDRKLRDIYKDYQSMNTQPQQPPAQPQQNTQYGGPPPQSTQPLNNPLASQYQHRSYTVDPTVKPQPTQAALQSGAQIQSAFGTGGVPSAFISGTHQEPQYHTSPPPTQTPPSETPNPSGAFDPHQALFDSLFGVSNSRSVNPQRPCDEIIADDPRHPNYQVVIVPVQRSEWKKTFDLVSPHSQAYDRTKSIMFHRFEQATGIVSEHVIHNPGAPMDYLLHETQPTASSGLPPTRSRTERIVPLDAVFPTGQSVPLQPMEEQTPENKEQVRDYDNILLLDTQFKGTSVEQIDTLVNVELSRNNLFDEWDHRPVQYNGIILSPYFNSDIVVERWLSEDNTDASAQLTNLDTELNKLAQCKTLNEYHRRLNWLYSDTACPLHIIAAINNQTTAAFNEVLTDHLNLEGWAISSFLIDWSGLNDEPSLEESFLEEFDASTTQVLIDKLNTQAAPRIILGGSTVLNNETDLADAYQPEGALGQFVGMEKLMVVLGKRISTLRVPYTNEQMSINIHEPSIVNKEHFPKLSEFLAVVKRNAAHYPRGETLLMISRDRVTVEVSESFYNKHTTVLIPRGTV